MLGSARAPNAPELILSDFRFGFGNIAHLMTPILSGRLAGIPLERRPAVFACFGKYRKDVVDIFNRYQVPIGSLVTRLTTGIALSGFLGASGPEFGARSNGRRRFRRIG
jgi:hypothetical protein